MLSDKHEWVEKARCSGMTTLFFPEIRRGHRHLREYKKALAMCKNCSVTKQCLEYSLSENLVEFGIFGGQLPSARKSLLEARKL